MVPSAPGTPHRAVPSAAGPSGLAGPPDPGGPPLWPRPQPWRRGAVAVACLADPPGASPHGIAPQPGGPPALARRSAGGVRALASAARRPSLLAEPQRWPSNSSQVGAGRLVPLAGWRGRGQLGAPAALRWLSPGRNGLRQAAPLLAGEDRAVVSAVEVAVENEWVMVGCCFAGSGWAGS